MQHTRITVRPNSADQGRATRGANIVLEHNSYNHTAQPIQVLPGQVGTGSPSNDDQVILSPSTENKLCQDEERHKKISTATSSSAGSNLSANELLFESLIQNQQPQNVLAVPMLGTHRVRSVVSERPLTRSHSYSEILVHPVSPVSDEQLVESAEVPDLQSHCSDTVFDEDEESSSHSETPPDTGTAHANGAQRQTSTHRTPYRPRSIAGPYRPAHRPRHCCMHKAVIIIGLLLLSFAVSKLPFAIVILVEAANPGSVPLKGHQLVTWLYWANLLPNPFIYAFMCKHYRTRGYMHTLIETLCCQKSNSVHPSG